VSSFIIALPRRDPMSVRSIAVALLLLLSTAPVVAASGSPASRS